MGHMHSALASIHTLPAEMLVAIFLDVALSLPALWAHIHICSTRERLEMIELFIERS